MDAQSEQDASLQTGWRNLAIWYAAAVLIGLFPILNTLFGFFALVFTFAALIVLGALLLRRRMITMSAGHLILGLLIAGSSWWFVTALLLNLD